MSSFHIRSIQYSDALQIQRLLMQLGYPLSDSEVRHCIEAYSVPPLYAFGYEQNRAVIGVIAIASYPLFLSPFKRTRIEAFVVDENFRGQGIGTRLLQYVEQFAAIQHSMVIDLTSSISRKENGTHDFYRHLGYENKGKEEKVYLRKNLDIKRIKNI